MHPQPASKFCEIRQTDSKGIGLFAKIDIKAGTLISDEVNIKISTGDFKFCASTWQNPDFWHHFRTYGAEDVETAMSGLTSYYKDDTFQQNVFERLSRSIPEDLSDNANLLFTACQSSATETPPFSISFGPTTCAFNHSCIANAALVSSTITEDPTKLLVKVVALKDIKAQTEITVSYRLSNLPTEGRRLDLRENFRFDCVCDVCMHASNETEENYATINRLMPDLAAPLEHEIKQRSPWLFFKRALELATTFDKLDIKDLRLEELWEACAAVAAYHSDALRTHYFLTFVSPYGQLLSHSKLMKIATYLFNPKSHPHWGHTEMGLSHSEDNELFRATEQSMNARVMMARHDEDSYDRIMPKEEAERKRQAALRERAEAAEEVARQLLAEEEAEKEKKPAASSAQQARRKKTKKQKGKKGPAAVVEEEGEPAGPASAGQDERLNAQLEAEVGGPGWEEVGGKKSSQQRAKPGPAATVAKKERKKTGPAPGAAVVERRKEMERREREDVERKKEREEMERKKERKEEEEEKKVEEGGVEEAEKEEEVVVEEERKGKERKDGKEEGGKEGGVFSVAEAALAGEKGTLRRLRGYSQPAPFSSAAMYDEDGLVLPGVGREFSWWCGAYADRPAAQK